MNETHESWRSSRPSHEPYYATQEQIDALRLELQSVDPELCRTVGALEKSVGNKFISNYREHLRDDQIKYFESSCSIIASQEEIHALPNIWDTEIRTTKPHSKLHGKIYQKYEADTSSEEDSGIAEDDETALQLWGGRIPIIPSQLFDDWGNKVFRPDMKWLITEKEYSQWRKITPLGEILKSTAPFLITHCVAQILLHEKVHGVQNYDYPLPILEASAYFYEYEFAQKYGSNHRDSNRKYFLPAILAWQGLIQRIGPDIHSFIFGNIKDEARWSEIDSCIREEFSEDKFPRLFSGIQWQIKQD